MMDMADFVIIVILMILVGCIILSLCKGDKNNCHGNCSSCLKNCTPDWKEVHRKIKDDR